MALALWTGAHNTGAFGQVLVDSARLPDVIYKNTDSLSCSKAPIVLFDGDNFTGQSVVITAAGWCNDLSSPPWGGGSWQNRIASAKLALGLSAEKLIEDYPNAALITPNDRSSAHWHLPPPTLPNSTSSSFATENELTLAVFHAYLSKADREEKKRLMEEMEQYLDPWRRRELHLYMDHPEVIAAFGRFDRENPSAIQTRGGGGQISGQGQSIVLGGSYIGQQITVNVQGAGCTVTIQAWMFAAQAPIGCWDVGGPGSIVTTLGGTCGGSGPLVGSPCTIKAVGKAGTFPAIVTFNLAR